MQQPVKFAAIEYVTRTGRDVPEYLGGFYVNGKVYFGLRIPYADSLLVGFKPSTKVTGLNSVAPADRPPALTLIHLSFDAMVGLAFVLLRRDCGRCGRGGAAAGCPGSPGSGGSRYCAARPRWWRWSAAGS